MRVFLLGSGSSGNSAVIESRGERIVVDAGINPTACATRMRALGADLITARAPLGVVVTHDHGDHASHAGPLARALSAPVFLQRGGAAPRGKRVEVRGFAPGETLRVGPFAIDSVRVPHDSPQVALRISDGTCSFGIATDLGHVTPALVPLLGACDVALVEANHCRDMLDGGPYPPRLKRRVRGPLGHLSNDQAAELASALAGTRLSRLVLGHLSLANNTPERALATVAPRCRGLALEVVPHGAPRLLDVAAPACPARPHEQLSLF